MKETLSTYGPLAIGVLGGFFGIWQLAIRIRNDLKLKVWEKRADTYTKYLAKLESIHRRVMIDYAQYTGTTMTSFLARMLETPEDTQPLLDLQQSLSQMMSKLITAVSESKEELVSLRLLSSDSLLAKLDAYTSLADKQLGGFADFMAKIKLLDPNMSNLVQEFSQQQAELGLDEMRKDIEKTMREELRVRQ